ncbi:hypothetical protein D3C81_1347100 [compost metagenome]
MQRPTPQFPQAQRIANQQPPGLVAKGARVLAVDMKLQEVVFARQACQGIGPGHRTVPQHHMLTGLITQCPLRSQAQAQHITEPVQCTDLCRHAVLQGVEHRYAQVVNHPALACQPPALCVFFQRQGLGPCIGGLPVQAMHQAGVTATCTAAVRHIQPRVVQGIEQIAAGGHRPAALAHTEFRHGHHFSGYTSPL